MTGLWNLLICSVTINLGAAIGTEIESIMGSSPRMWSRDKDMLYLSKRWDVQHRSYRQVLQMWETWIRSLGWKDPLEREWLCTPVFWPGESHGQRSLAGYSPWGHRVRPNFRTCTMHMRSREIWSVIGGGMGYLNWRDATWIPDSFLVLPELQHHSLPTFVSEITFNESNKQCQTTVQWCQDTVTLLSSPFRTCGTWATECVLCHTEWYILGKWWELRLRARVTASKSHLTTCLHPLRSFPFTPLIPYNTISLSLFFFCLGQLELSTATWKQRTLTDTSFS